MTTNDSPRPKPAPPKPKVPAETMEEKLATRATQGKNAPSEKPKFVRKPHLTERPFKAHEGLQKLQQEMNKSTPRRGQRRTNKEKK